MKKILGAVIVIIVLGIAFTCSHNYVINKVDSSLQLTEDAIKAIENDDYDLALVVLTTLKDELEEITPALEKLLEHQNIEELIRSIDESIVYCEYKVKTEAIKELVGAKFYLKSLKEVETLSFKSIF